MLLDEGIFYAAKAEASTFSLGKRERPAKRYYAVVVVMG